MKLALLLAALGLSHPGDYEKAIQEGSKALKIDPLMVVEIMWHESRMHEKAISKDGEDYGLTQIRARYRPGCLLDKDPVHAPSKACAQEKQKLLNGAYNLQAMFEAIGTWISVCKKKTGFISEESYLWAYSGLNRPKQGKWCGYQQTAAGWVRLPIPSVVKQFLAGRRAMRLRLEALPPG
jgi:transglycosylase-like protein with SLT domain